jgi:hypothetical protein
MIGEARKLGRKNGLGHTFHDYDLRAYVVYDCSIDGSSVTLLRILLRVLWYTDDLRYCGRI